MPDTRKDDWPTTWPPWVLQIARDMERAESKHMRATGTGVPQWVENIAIELTKCMFPPMDGKGVDKTGPRIIGRILGQQKRLIEGNDHYLSMIERAGINIVLLRKRLKQKLTTDAFKRLEKAEADTRKRIRSIVEQKEQAIARGLALAQKQTAEEESEFFAGYAETLNAPIFEQSGALVRERFPGTSKLYAILLFSWPRVQQMQSVGELHRWLSTITPPQQLGEIDRLKGICKRFKIKLAPRGRPRKIMGH